MHREKKKKLTSHLDHSDDDISIFDSEEQIPQKREPVAPRNQRKNQNTRRKRGQRSRQSKLNLEEERIMNSLMKTNKEEESEIVSQNSEKGKDMENQTKVSPAEQAKPQNSCPVRNNLDDELNQDIPQDELHWSDLEQIIEQHKVEQPRVKRQYTRHVQPHSRSNKYHLMPAMVNRDVMTPQEQLKFEDFQMMNIQEGNVSNVDYCGLVQLQEIEQLQREITSELPAYDNDSNKKANSLINKDDPQLRRSAILKQIDRLRQDLMQIQDLQESKAQAAYSSPSDNNKEEDTLFNDWKYEPQCNLSKNAEKGQNEKEQSWRLSKSKTEGRIVMLKHIISANPFLTQVEMVDVLKKKDPVMNQRIERSVVLRLLKVGGFKKKKIRTQHPDCNSQRNIQLRREYALKLLNCQNSNTRIYYYDQMVISEFFDKESGWCNGEEEIEQRPYRFILRSFVVMMMIGDNGRCWWNVSFGDSPQREYCHTFSKLLKAVEESPASRLIIINHLSYRKPANIREIVERRDWKLLVLPLHGLHLNPLLTYFAGIRETLKKRRYESIQRLFEAIVQTLQEGDRCGWGQRSLARSSACLNKALNCQPF